MEANMFPMTNLVLSVPATNLEKTYCVEGTAAKAIWKKAEVLFFQFCGKRMLIVVNVVHFRPEL